MRTQKYFQAVVTPHPLPPQGSREALVSGHDGWCWDSSPPYWDGQDFSRCARLKYLIGEPALVLVFLLGGSFILPYLPRLWERIWCKNNGGPSTKRSVATYEAAPQVTRKDPDLNGPQAVSQAEDQIIAIEVMREGGLGIDEQDRQKLLRVHNLPCPPNIHRDSCVEPTSYSSALAQSWKEFSITACTVGMLFTAVARYFISTDSDLGSHWLLVPIILWLSVSVISTMKLFIQIQSKIRNKPHPDPKYFWLEYRTVPIYLVSLPLELLDTRSILLQHLAGQHNAEATFQLMVIRLLTLTFLILANVLEVITPRPTTLLPGASKNPSLTIAAEPDIQRPGPLEPGRSLLSLAYFIHTDSYLWRHKNSTAVEESIPDVRVDDKSAAVLFRWKKDQDEYEIENIKPSFLRALSWHFRNILLSQQLFAYFNAVGSLLPPFFLQRIIGYISSKSSENPQPVHVAFLYAFGMLATQVFLAFSQSASLMIGRRLSVRLRALLITLIFTKSLRRTGVNPKVSEVTDSSDDGSSSTDSKSPSKEDPEASASTGKIANLVSNDVASLAEIGAYLHFLWPESAIQIILAGIYLYVLLGYSALAGMFCIVIAVPIQSYLTALWARYQDMLMAAADKRLGLATEVINNIKVVKFFAWESNFLQKMQVLREAELAMLFKRLLVTIAESTVSFSVPIFVSIVTFYTHTKVFGKSLTAEEAFTALALFNVFRFPLSVLVGMISGLLQSYVSLKRIESFLNEKETEKYSTLSVPRPEAGDPLVGFKNATFTYDAKQEGAGPIIESSTFKLSGLDFGFPEGKLSLIIGRVGSGKGTLLLSLLGETTKLSGEAFLPSPVSRAWGLDPDVQLTDTTAYCPQQAWLLSDSIRNNILYGSVMNRSRYTQVLKACALASDLTTFTDGDLTEIGDKGTVLSGGQKARISLARALYSPAKVLLLDDVLSAVDSHTAQHLFNHVLNGPLMRDRTCILVTHAVDLCMPAASFVVSLDRGQVVYAGDPSLSKLASALVTVSQNTEVESNTSATVETSPELTIETLAAPVLNDDDAVVEIKTRATQRLVEEEHQAVGAVSLTTYKLYYDCLGGLMPLFNTFILFILAEIGNVLSTWVLKQWAESNQTSPGLMNSISYSLLNSSNVVTSTKISSTSPELLYFHSDSLSEKDPSREARLDRYILLYLLTGLFALAFELIRETYFTCRSIIAGRKIYERLIRSLLNAQVRFFDTVPMGRVLNRLSTDVRTVDRDLADALIYMAEDVLGAIAILIVVVAVLPMGFLFSTMGACLIYVAIGYLYLSSTREIKRSESTSRSPVISLCTECLGGVTSIRAYGDIGRYTQQMFKLIDAYNRPFFMLWMCNRWLSCRIDTAAALFTFLVVIYMIQSDMPAALSGFALSYVITLNTKTLWIVRWWSVNEINFNSMERIHEYLGIDQEPKNGIPPPAAWPSKQGTIEVEGLTARYAPHLPPVLKSVSFSVKAGEKIGICGRTGSGKSTLALSFFRFIEAESGRIVIDGLDISKLDLSSLRGRLTIIPQESVLFSATIRWNLDPFSEHDDSRIWDALRRVGMAAPSFEIPSNGRNATNPPSETSSRGQDLQFITSLDMEVKEGGKNFSTGQRQLLAIARAILKLENSALLILDESTASLDAESDEKIQATIRSEMGNSTILCIAHRLKTIIDYDKVLVLSDGEVLEFDEPWKLLLDDDESEDVKKPSAFKELCLKSGHYDELKQAALQAKTLRSKSH